MTTVTEDFLGLLAGVGTILLCGVVGALIGFAVNNRAAASSAPQVFQIEELHEGDSIKVLGVNYGKLDCVALISTGRWTGGASSISCGRRP